MTLSGTWLGNFMGLHQYLQLPTYKFKYRNKIVKKVGGLGLHVKETANFKDHHDLQLDEDMWVWNVFYQLSSNKKVKLLWAE